MNQLSRNIQHLMHANGIVHATELSQLTGVTQPTIHRWLHDSTRDPSHKRLSIIADYFGVTLDSILNEDLTGGDKNRAPTKTELGVAFKMDREALGLSQSELARKLDVPSQSVSRWESGQMIPRDYRLEQLANLFGQNSYTYPIAEKILKTRYVLRKQNGRATINPTKKPHTRAFEPSEKHFRKNLRGDISFETDFYFSTDGYFVIEQEVDGMRVALTPQQLEDFLDMVHENDLVNEAYMARYGPKERKICTSKETS